MQKTNNKLLIANWKSHKTLTDGLEWMRIFTSFDLTLLHHQLQIVICPPASLLYPLKIFIEQYPTITLGAQDIASNPAGAHTGEISAENLVGLIQYVIIGHSEIRKKYNLTEEEIKAKITIAQKFAFNPIVCINEKTKLDYDADIVVFEPPSAINYGTPHVKTVEEVKNVKQKLLVPEVEGETQPSTFLYGGSVSPDNADDFLKDDVVDGFLVGTNSLDPLSFFSIAQKF